MSDFWEWLETLYCQHEDCDQSAYLFIRLDGVSIYVCEDHAP